MTFFGYPHREESVFDFLERTALEPEQLGVSWPDLREPERFDPINFRPILHVCQISWRGRDKEVDWGFEVACSCGIEAFLNESRGVEFVELHERIPCEGERFTEARDRFLRDQAAYLAYLDSVFGEERAA